MALPTQPNGSSIVPLAGSGAPLGALGSVTTNTQTTVTQKTLNTVTGQTESETVSLIQ